MTYAHFVWLLCWLLLCGGAANAQTLHSMTVGEDKKGGALSELREEGTHIVTAIVDPTTVILDNKKVVRLAGIELPIYPGEKESLYAAVAVQRLQALYLGQKVVLFETRKADKGRMNATGQIMGHIVKREDGKEYWAQKIMVEEGMMRALPTLSNPEGAQALYNAEDAPREERQGLWGTQAWSVKDPNSVNAYMGTIQVVRGTVANVSTRNNLTYVNFGRDWRTDFTILIDAQTRRALLRAGLNPLSLAHKNIEVRGFIEDWNGPSIMLDNAALLRVIPDESGEKTP